MNCPYHQNQITGNRPCDEGKICDLCMATITNMSDYKQQKEEEEFNQFCELLDQFDETWDVNNLKQAKELIK